MFDSRLPTPDSRLPTPDSRVRKLTCCQSMSYMHTSTQMLAKHFTLKPSSNPPVVPCMTQEQRSQAFALMALTLLMAFFSVAI